MTGKKRSKILIVDDTEVNIDILVEFLGDTYDVSTAPDGFAALESVAANPPDLILLDIMMPGLDGFGVCAKLKGDAATSDIPIIFVTTLSDMATESRGFDLGAADFITKPFSSAVVRARVKNHLALREAARFKADVEQITRHDLNSPLTTVIDLPQRMLSDENLSNGLRDMLQRIEDAGRSLLAMTNLSSALFKMEQEAYTLAPAKIDLTAEARKVLSALEDAARTRGIRLQLIVNGADTPAPVHFMGEELLCHSMIWNIVDWAVEASPQEDSVLVSIESKSSSLIRIDITCKTGAPLELRDIFFEKYACDKKSGTGLRTYSARLIARTHGGDAIVSSKDGKVVISIFLPA